MNHFFLLIQSDSLVGMKAVVCQEFDVLYFVVLFSANANSYTLNSCDWIAVYINNNDVSLF